MLDINILATNNSISHNLSKRYIIFEDMTQLLKIVQKFFLQFFHDNMNRNDKKHNSIELEFFSQRVNNASNILKSILINTFLVNNMLWQIFLN